jgi:hypothetical protein
LETPFSKYRFVRELQLAWTRYFLELQEAMLGGESLDLIQKASPWEKSIDLIRKNFFGRLAWPVPKGATKQDIRVELEPSVDYSKFKLNTKTLEFTDGTVVNRDDLDKADKKIFDFLALDWNKVYKQERHKATILGYIAGHFMKEGMKPSKLTKLTLPEVDDELRHSNLPGLDSLDELESELGIPRDRAYQLIYAQSKGAEWLAVYNSEGQRKGRAYDLITKMYRTQIAEAIARGKDIGEIQSLMRFPDDSDIKRNFGLFEEGIHEVEYDRREREYMNFVARHLNRDMQRFAYTEVQINFNNGMLLQLANEKDPSKPIYVEFVKIR